jgi:uncharacterized lipoprotein YddW (UPF0748 family)
MTSNVSFRYRLYAATRAYSAWALVFFAFALAGAYSQQVPKREFRGVWISSVYNIDFPARASDSPEEQRAEFRRILDAHRQIGVNAVFVQVRPSADALYPSTLEPWSQWLSGAQGRAPEPVWDPLQFMIEETHARGMEFHAWFNPFRSVVTASASVAPNHISQTQPSWHLAFTNPHRLLNPGLPQVRRYVVSVIMDVVRRYDIDGVHFDDYFYPYEGTTTQDAATFQEHSRGIGNIGDWRRDNVNLFIKMTADSIRAVKPFVKFGVSPFGIWRNGVPAGTTGLDAYATIYCDALAWLRDGSVDYLIPQLYWKFGGGQDYARLAPWWLAETRQAERHLYAGLGAYRLTDASWTRQDITRQVDFNRANGVEGSVFFSSNSLVRDLQGLRSGLAEGAFRSLALPPQMPWKDPSSPRAPLNLRVETARENDKTVARLVWDAPPPANDGDTAVRYAVYRFPDDATPDIEDARFLRAVVPLPKWTDAEPPSSGGAIYAVTALDRLHNESAPLVARLNATTGVRFAEQPAFTVARLEALSPNPAASVVAARFYLPRAAFVRVVVFDAIGRELSEAARAEFSAGEHRVEISLDAYPSGAYTLMFFADGAAETRRFIVQK